MRHLDVHSGARAHACDECDEKFGWRYEIVFHRLCHMVDDDGYPKNKVSAVTLRSNGKAWIGKEKYKQNLQQFRGH